MHTFCSFIGDGNLSYKCLLSFIKVYRLFRKLRIHLSGVTNALYTVDRCGFL